MLAFLSARFRRWVFMAVAIPLGGWVLERLGDGLEQRRGRSKASDRLRSSGQWIAGQGRHRGRRAQADLDARR